MADGEQFVKGAGDSALSNVTFGSADPVTDNPTMAYETGRIFGDSLGIADGIGTIVGGAATMVGGGLLDATVLLTPAGAALNVAGAAVVGYGGAESLKATHGLTDDLHSLFSRDGEGSSGGEVPPKEKTEGTSEGTGKAGTRPTWRQSEQDASSDYPGYQAQQSFKDGKPVTHGTKGSSRPDLYIDGHSIEVKNYNVTTSQGRNNLINNVAAQVNKRKADLPQGTEQTVQIDLRGQDVSRQELKQIRDGINKKTDNGAEVIFKMN